MDTSRGDVGIAIRSAFLGKGSKQKFSLIVLIIFSIVLIFAERIEIKPLNYIRGLLKDTIYRGSLFVSLPAQSFNNIFNATRDHLNLYTNYENLIEENNKLKNNISKQDFLEMENIQLRKLIEEQISSSANLVSARVLMDQKSPYLNSFIINAGTNKDIKNGMAALDGENFIGRIVDVSFFSSRVLLISDLNSRIPAITEPSGTHAIISGHGINNPTLEYLPENHNVKDGDKIYTSGKEGIFAPGIPIGKVKIENNIINVLLFSDLSQITFTNVKLGDKKNYK
jgi:rod shape-determining protein MreC